jgi:hypothetical protein
MSVITDELHNTGVIVVVERYLLDHTSTCSLIGWCVLSLPMGTRIIAPTPALSCSCRL